MSIVITPNQRGGYTKPLSHSREVVGDPQKQVGQRKTGLRTDTSSFNGRVEIPVTYSQMAFRKNLDTSDVAALKNIADQANENLRMIVEELILKQGKSYQVFQIKGLSSDGEFDITGIKEAQLSISEDGEFGVKAVSDRLVSFAKMISCEDKTKFIQLKSAIEEGFEAARDLLGGYLPDICNETYNETMRKLEAWANEEYSN